MELKALVEREVRNRAAEILREAEERASRILRRAEVEAAEVLSEYRPVARNAYTQSLHSHLSRYYTQAKERVLGTQMSLLNEAREEAVKSLKEVVENRERYADLLKRLIEETLNHITGRATIYVNPRDVELVRDILAELPQEWVMKPPKAPGMWNVNVEEWEVVGDERVWAGVVIRDAERNFILNNDLMVRLERAYQMLLEEFRKEVGGVEG